MKFIRYFLIFIPLSIAARYFNVNEVFAFLSVCLSIIPLAGIIGDATEQISIYTGSKVGGLITATTGNLPELLIGFFAVKSGFITLVLSSMSGSIISNILLVLGVSIFLGGLKQKSQTFNKNIARSNFILLFFVAMTTIIPFTLEYAIKIQNNGNLAKGLHAISISLAIALLVTYISGLIFSLMTNKNIFVKQNEQTDKNDTAKWSLAKSALILCVAAFFIAIESEMLVNYVEHIIESYHLPETFIGIILIPILGNIAENISAIVMAIKNKIDLCIEIAIGSSIQIALFVAPLLILVSYIIGNPIIYVYDVFELVAMLISIGLSLFIFQDGKTNWFEGVVLIVSYIILGVAFFYI